MNHKRHAARQGRPSGTTGGEWIYGAHACQAALANRRRTVRRILILAKVANRWDKLAKERGLAPEITDEARLAQMLGPGAVHQGVAILAEPLPPPDLEEVLAAAKPPRLLVVLDQVTDPHNVGAILRSAAAFGATAVVVQDRHSPPLSGVLTKTASGAADIVPYIPVVNISRTLADLTEQGFTVAGLAEEAERTLAETDMNGDAALVFGAEGEGLRRLTREYCDVLVKLPTAPAMPSLNVSNAVAIALYDLAGRRKK